jgi:hypothetical protein
MPHDAFISYSTHDKASADAACVALEAAGIRCWIAPRDIMPGAEWGEAIVKAIHDCRVLILIFSANANESPQIRREVERAVSKGVPVMPLRIQDIAPARSLEYFIGTVHWLDALTPPLEAHLRRLVESVKALLQIDPVVPRLTPQAAGGGKATAPWTRRVAILGLLMAACGAGFGSWAFFAGRNQTVAAWNVPQAAPPHAAPAPVSAAPAGLAPVSAAPASAAPTGAAATGRIDPALVGTFERDAVVNGYNVRFVSSVTADGTYHLVITEAEGGNLVGETQDSGNCVFANDQWRLSSRVSGQTTQGTYQVIDANDIELTGPNGSAVWRRISQ